jgi:hypothetical protein
MVIVALVFDTVYPLFVLRAFYVVQALILVVALAIGPYALVRGITTHLTRGFYKKQAGPANLSAAKTTEDTEGR